LPRMPKKFGGCSPRLAKAIRPFKVGLRRRRDRARLRGGRARAGKETSGRGELGRGASGNRDVRACEWIALSVGLSHDEPADLREGQSHD
jgi:hypothetical protein